jgi:pyruvate formate lyase activating enzyme
MFYDRGADGTTTCRLCPFRCVVANGQRGRCRVRENRAGTYVSLVYGMPVAINNDPVEKKPLFHVHPGAKAFSIATVGCNIACKFCQNWDISQAHPEDAASRTRFTPPREIAAAAGSARSRLVAYTYSEPIVFYEYMHDCALAAREAGLGNVMISNGMIEPGPMEKLAPLLTAVKIDLKAFNQSFYDEVCGGDLEAVKRTLKLLARLGVWFEIVVLLIPTLNDGEDEIKRLAAWSATELGPNVPLHFTRFRPAYKMRNLPPTPPRTLTIARRTAMAEGCRFVYTGNLQGDDGESTYCPSCGARAIHRYGMMTLANELRNGACPKCREPIPGVWE